MTQAVRSAPQVHRANLNSQIVKPPTLKEFFRSLWQSVLAEILCRTAGEVS